MIIELVFINMIDTKFTISIIIIYNEYEAHSLCN